MRLTCFLIAKGIVEHPATGEARPWVTRHVARCPRCQAAVEAHLLMRAAVRQVVPVEAECPVSWDAIAARLADRPQRGSILLRRAVLAGAVLCALIAAVLAVILLGGNQGSKQTRAAHSPTPKAPPNVTVPKPKAPAIVVREPAASVVAPAVQPTRHHRLRRHRHRPVSPPTTVPTVAKDDRGMPTHPEQIVVQPDPTDPPELTDPRLIAISETSGSMAAEVLIGLSEQMTEEKGAEIQQKVVTIIISALPRFSLPDAGRSYQ